LEIGVGLDPTLRLSWDDQRQMAHEAADLGYSSAWTPSGPAARDAFHLCAQWNMATRDVVRGGLGTGISVVPVPTWSPPVLASQAGTVGELTEGRFMLGIGSGGIYSAEFQRTWGRPAWPPIAMMRDYVTTVRALLGGEKVDYEGPSVSLHGVQLSFKPPGVPVLLGALGPQMLRLAGEVSDGAALNWCTPEQIAVSREKVDAGARKAGRDPSEVQLVEYIRVCVDDDIMVARRAYTRAAMGYALGRVPGASQSGYRAHFGRMGYDDDLKRIESGRANGMSEEDVVDAFPPEMLLGVGYYGPASGAAEAFRRLSTGLDIAIVRVVAARPGVESVRAVMRACAPQLVQAE
jgi:alkanesulfonate monooxygenase SsuD/methylene tetrahydromethanopterin reductase-like flavin-dependent oxidoreductase (luciferase family)